VGCVGTHDGSKTRCAWQEILSETVGDGLQWLDEGMRSFNRQYLGCEK
jgi:hypothetical protein